MAGLVENHRKRLLAHYVTRERDGGLHLRSTYGAEPLTKLQSSLSILHISMLAETARI